MANRFLSAGDETKNHLLAGVGSLQDASDGGSGTRGGVGFGVLPLLERIIASVAAAAGEAAANTTGAGLARRPGGFDEGPTQEF